MTKRERLSFALRRLRNLTTHKNAALRVQGAHQIVKEIIDELSKGTKNHDIGYHVIELLDSMYSQSIEGLEADGITVLQVMPDYAEQIRAQIEALKALPGDDMNAQRTETAAILHHTLSLFAQDANEEPIQALLSVCDELTERENTLPPPITDYSEQLRPHIDTLNSLEVTDDPEVADDTAIAALSEALSVFAQGPNEAPIQAVLSAFDTFHKHVKALPPPLPDYSEQLQASLDALANLQHDDEPDEPCQAATSALCHALSAFAQGPNEAPIRALLEAFDTLKMRAKPPAPSLPDHSEQIRTHIDALAALNDLDDPDVVTAAAAMALYDTIAAFAQGPNEAPIRTLLDTFDKVTGAK